jgi:hypothetical protein
VVLRGERQGLPLATGSFEHAAAAPPAPPLASGAGVLSPPQAANDEQIPIRAKIGRISKDAVLLALEQDLRRARRTEAHR